MKFSPALALSMTIAVMTVLSACGGADDPLPTVRKTSSPSTVNSTLRALSVPAA